MPDSPHSVPQPNAASPGMQCQFEIYQLGLAGKKLSVPIPLSQLEKKAAEVLSPQAYDYVAGSASGERTARANLAAFDRWRIVPRMLRDVSQRDLAVELLDLTLPAPVLLAPIGVQSIVHPDAEVAVARAASSEGVPFILSTASSRPSKRSHRQAGGPALVPTLLGQRSRTTASFLQRAENAGYTAIVVTLDTNLLSWRERDVQNAYLPFLLGEGTRQLPQRSRLPLASAAAAGADPQAAIRLWALFTNPTLTWADLAFLRRTPACPLCSRASCTPTTPASPSTTV